MSAEVVLGRTWHRSPAVDAPVPDGHHTLVFRLPASALRHNSVYVSDITAPGQRALLRAFRAVAVSMWNNSQYKAAGGQRAFVQWDDDGSTEFVFINAPLADGDARAWDDEVDAALVKHIQSEVRLVPKLERLRWSASDLVLDDDAFAALHGNTAPLTSTPSMYFGTHGPTSQHAWGRPPTPGMPHRATLLRAQLREAVFFEKLLPRVQQLNFPDVPLCSDDPDKDAELRMNACIPPPARSKIEQSDWELLMARARTLELTLAPAEYRAWLCRQLACTLDGESAGFQPKMEKSLNVWPNEALPPVPWPRGDLSAFGTLVAYYLTNLDTYGFFLSAHITAFKCFAAALDVYKEAEPGSLHYNLLLAGPPAASKSFVLSCVERMLVPGTVSTATRRTANSKAYDVDNGGTRAAAPPRTHAPPLLTVRIDRAPQPASTSSTRSARASSPRRSSAT